MDKEERVVRVQRRLARLEARMIDLRNGHRDRELELTYHAGFDLGYIVFQTAELDNYLEDLGIQPEFTLDLPNAPYIETKRIVTDRVYNKEYGDQRKCECGHSYYRHFDTYEGMDACGCKYCHCHTFVEAVS